MISHKKISVCCFNLMYVMFLFRKFKSIGSYQNYYQLPTTPENKKNRFISHSFFNVYLYRDTNYYGLSIIIADPYLCLLNRHSIFDMCKTSHLWQSLSDAYSLVFPNRWCYWASTTQYLAYLICVIIFLLNLLREKLICYI